MKITKANKLHEKLCDVLIEVMDQGEIVEVDGVPVKRRPSPAMLNVVRQFLKDNDITGIPVEGSPLGELTAETRKALPFQESGDVQSLMVADRDADEV